MLCISPRILSYCLLNLLIFPTYSHNHASGSYSTLMACLCEGGCQSLLRKGRSRSWSTLGDSLWCQLFLSQMQGIAFDKQKPTSSLTSWECPWVIRRLRKILLSGISLASPATSAINLSSHLVYFQITQDQVIMSHSPLRMFKKFHDKCVLVSGQGPVLEIAKQYPGILHCYAFCLWSSHIRCA